MMNRIQSCVWSTINNDEFYRGKLGQDLPKTKRFRSRNGRPAPSSDERGKKHNITPEFSQEVDPLSKSKRQIETKTMVRITELVLPISDEVEEWYPGVQAEVYDGEQYKAFLRGQLEVFLPMHDRAQDELIQLLPPFAFLPDDASDQKRKIYEEVCAKKVRLLRLQRERTALMGWFTTFLTDDIPLVSREMHIRCQDKVKKFFIGKARFYRTCRRVHKLMYKLHSIDR